MKKILAGFSFGVFFYLVLYIFDFSLDSFSPLAFFDGVFVAFGSFARIITVILFGIVGVVLFLLLFNNKAEIPVKSIKKFHRK
ncbi:hypothetical protein JXM83_01305 [Candidatus Woesearchaeota archaeon]|nr:hypothetical protein [Candidatus Woesearchaeota archaeon]